MCKHTKCNPKPNFSLLLQLEINTLQMSSNFKDARDILCHEYGQQPLVTHHKMTLHVNKHTLTSMATENFLINNCCDGQTVETVSECFPQSNVESSFT